MSPTPKVCLLSAVVFLSVASPYAAYSAEEPAPPAVNLSGYIEAGITFNADSPRSKKNFGQLFTDSSNRPVLNQAVLTLDKAIDPATDYSVGFKLQGMYGSDARLTHFLGVFEHSINRRNQIDLVEANVSVHTPWIGEGGMDVKAGFYPTLLGAEVIDPSGNTFYSKSYIFNFGLPLKHTGVLTNTHVNSTLDVYAGIDTGTNTTFGRRGDNNGALGYILGFGLNGLADGKVTILAASHIGAENARGTPGVRVNKDLRYFNDIVITAKATDALTLITELNYVKDDGFNAAGYGLSQYAVYAFDDSFSLAGRAEIWRDSDGFFVASFPGNFDFIDFQHAAPTATAIGGGKTTYGALTLGVTWKLPLPSPVTSIAIRPEIRYDRSLNSTLPYNDGTSDSQFTAAVDLIIKF